LSEREMQVFTLLEQGLSRPEIAEQLHLSPNTVRTHVQRILRRLNTHSTLAALALARDGDGSRLP
jgi:DNA-binding NarL/FixJ family response regulator